MDQKRGTIDQIKERMRVDNLYVQFNDDEVEPYVERHKKLLQSSNRNRNENWITRKHNECFISWLEE